MYIPGPFKIENKEKILNFIQIYNFGIINSIETSHQNIISSHIPFLLEKSFDGNEHLLCHFAKSNNHWKVIEQNPKVQIIFSGPHAYISPTYYVNSYVPTWNYATVHITGEAHIISKSNERLDSMEKLVFAHEKNDKNWDLSTLDSSYIASKMNSVIVVKISNLRYEAKFKLNQDKKDEDIESVIDHLIANGGSDEVCGSFMKSELTMD